MLPGPFLTSGPEILGLTVLMVRTTPPARIYITVYDGIPRVLWPGPD
jgi:hypothetical protein